MTMIVMHHIIVHGLGLAEFPIAVKTPNSLLAVELSYNAFLTIGVNAFVLISGYYGIKYKTKNLFSLFLQGLIYSVSIWYICHTFLGREGFISPVQYWFCVCYFALYLISPYINKSIADLADRQLIALTTIILFLLCIIGFAGNAHHVLGGGYGFVQILAMYITGRTINRFREFIGKIKIKHLLVLFAICYLGVLIPAFSLFHKCTAMSWNLFSYDNPLNIINACILFLLFSKIKIKIDWIRKISSHMLGVYMLHENGFSREFLKHIVLSLISNWEQALFFIPSLAVVIVILGIIIDIPIAIAINTVINHHLVRKVIGPIDRFVQI